MKTAHVVLRVFAFLGTLGFADAHAYRPLIILHGFSESGNHAVPQAVKQQALELGVPEYLIFTPTMPNSAACIESSADWFAGVVNAVLVQTGAAQVDIVAHSLGGIVARTYMKRHNAFRHVRNLVTVASPNHGMRAAALLALICSSRQVMMGSSFLRSLNTTETPDPTFYSTVVGNRDPVVSPFESAGLSGARNEVVNGAGHWNVIYSDQARTLIRDALMN